MSSPRAPRRRDDPTHRANSRLTAAATKGAREWTHFQYSPPRPRSPLRTAQEPVESAGGDDDEDDGFKVHKKSAGEANSLAKTYEDITLNCRDCNAEFVFTSGEQEFYASKGWENQPTRCVECKNAKKARFGEGLSAKPVCYAFQRGECTRGDACRFSHDPNAGAAPQRSTAPCYAFQRGECTRGDACRFSHDPNATAPKASGVCYAFQKGECTRGDACRFQHTAE